MNKQALLDEVVWNIPYGVKANCYLFALAPVIGKGGYAERPFKSQPGYKCQKYRQQRLDFTSCKDLSNRIKCDNPLYIKKISKKDMHNNFSNHYHVICTLLSPSMFKQDFHFLRRLPYKSFLKSIDKFKTNMSLKTKLQLELLKNSPPKYIWAHQRGWSHGGPIVHDANGDLILDPTKANFNYGRIDYNKLCGFYKVRTRKATVFNTYDRETSIKKILYENEQYKIGMTNKINIFSNVS